MYPERLLKFKLPWKRFGFIILLMATIFLIPFFSKALAQTSCLEITPSGTIDLGTVTVGNYSYITFTLKNTCAGNLTGSVSAVPPWSILIGVDYYLGENQTKEVTVRFAPDSAQVFNGTLNFTETVDLSIPKVFFSPGGAHTFIGTVTTKISGSTSVDVTGTGLFEPPTVINLSSFTAKAKGKRVVLKWRTETEIENLGFNILRAETEDGEYVKINKELIPAKGNSIHGSDYIFIDKNVNPEKTFYYKLEDIDMNGKQTLNGPVPGLKRSKAGTFR